MMDSPNSKSAASSSKRREKSAGGASSTSWRSNSVGSSSDNWRNQKSGVSIINVSRTSPLSPDSSDAPRSTSRKPTFNQLTNQVIKKAAKIFHLGKVLSVTYERKFGFLAPSDGDDTYASNVYFRVPAPGDQLTSTLTGGMILIPEDVMEYELANCGDNQKSQLQGYVSANLAELTNL